MRLIVSFDSFDGKPAILHVSGSYYENSKIDRELRAISCNAAALRTFIGMVRDHFNQLCGRMCLLALVIVSDRGIPHFFGPTPKEFCAGQGKGAN
jgi:hypothetical protein